MRTYKKILLYKRLFLVFIALNVFCVCAGLVVGIDHWKNKVGWKIQQEKAVLNLEKTHKAKKMLFSMLQGQREKLQRNHKDYEEQLFIRWKQWEHLQALLNDLDEKKWAESLSSSFNVVNGPTQANLENVYAHLSDLETRHHKSLAHIGNELHAVAQQIVWVALLTLIFGVFLPGVLFFLTGKALNIARKELQSQVRTWVDEWMKQYEMAGEEPFKNVDFWVRIALLAVEGASLYGRHPMLDLSADISHLIRAEMNKSQRHTDEKVA